MPNPAPFSISQLPAPNLVDTHCHIHEPNYPLDRDEVQKRAEEAGVKKLICVATDEASSVEAIAFAARHAGAYAAVGVHPHEAKGGWGRIAELASGKWNKEDGKEISNSNSQAPTAKPVAVGEIGLDYYYTHSPRDIQIEALQAQIETALQYDLPIIFHVREAFDDFWPIFDAFRGIRGVLHSFTDSQANLEEGLKRGLFIGVNGISTFTKDKIQQAMFQAIPLDRLLLETDAPFLTPAPFRGKVNEPAYVREVAEHQASIRNIPFGDIAAATTANAEALFAL